MRPLRRLAVVATLAMATAACETPQVPPAVTGSSVTPTPDGATSEPVAPATPTTDPGEEVVRAAAVTLATTLATARDLLTALAEETDEQASVDLALQAVAALAAEPAALGVAGAPTPTVAPLLPGPATSREETIDHGDALTIAMTAARDAGAAGAALTDAVRDPVAGDLGAWQRDPAGMLGIVRALAERRLTIEEAETAVADELSGEASRALAWALLAAGSDDLATRRAAGERGAVHVTLMLDAIRPLADVLSDDAQPGG